MIQLRDGDLAVSIHTGFGNNAGSMTFRGEEILWTPAGLAFAFSCWNPAAGALGESH